MVEKDSRVEIVGKVYQEGQPTFLNAKPLAHFCVFLVLLGAPLSLAGFHMEVVWVES